MQDEEDNSQDVSEKFVVFSLGDELFAVSAEKITEVAQPLQITPLPKLPEWFFGITNLRGEIVSVLNFSKLAGKPYSVNLNKSKLIVIREYNNFLAIATNRINEIAALPEDSISPCHEENSYFYAQATFNSKTLNLIDTAKLFSNLSDLSV